MKAILEFDLDNPEDVHRHHDCINVNKFKRTLSDINNFLRSYGKYGSDNPLMIENYEMVDTIRKEFFIMLENNGLTVDDI